MPGDWTDEFRKTLVAERQRLELLLERILANRTQPLEHDSAERAVQLQNQEVVDALGNDARLDLENIKAALARIDARQYGICDDCGNEIQRARLRAYPLATKCIGCASAASTEGQ